MSIVPTLIDFQDLKTRVSVEQVLAMLNIHLKKNGSQLRGTCPICNQGGDRVFVVTPDRNAFICFGQCKARGDIISLVAAVKNIPARQAAEVIAQQFGGGKPVPTDRTPTAPQASKAGFDADKYAASLDPTHASLEALGVSPQTFREWRAGYCKTGVLRGRLALPVTRDAAIVGYLGRATSDAQSPSLLFPNGLSPMEYIFGEDKVVGDRGLQLVRDVLDVIRASEMGMSAVCFLTETIAPIQLEQLAALMDRTKCTDLEIL